MGQVQHLLRQFRRNPNRAQNGFPPRVVFGQHGKYLAEQGLASVVAQRKVAARKGVNRQIWQGVRKEIIVAVQVQIFAQSNHV
jgi:hypothetical protein